MLEVRRWFHPACRCRTCHSHKGTNASGGDNSDVSHFDGRSRHGHLVVPMDDITIYTLRNQLLTLIDLVYRLPCGGGST